MTATSHLPSARVGRLLRIFLVLLAASTAMLRPASAEAYSWPLKPFDAQHPVRGFFGDPRIADDRPGEGSFHFGIDICAADGTPVYATITGRVVVETTDPNVVSVASGRVRLSYWHIVPFVKPGQFVVARRTVVGRVQAPWGHVHLSESRGGVYVNPLRPGALSPYVDRTRPVVEAIAFERPGAGGGVGRTLRGRVDLVAQVGDRQPVHVPDRFGGKPVMPALVRWRLVGAGLAGGWHTAVDFRGGLPVCPFAQVYARWTRQNKPWRRGRYRVVLARGLDTTNLVRGQYRLEVLVADSRGNTSVRSRPFTVAR